MLAAETDCNRLSNTLVVLAQKQATGKLLLENEEQQWQVYFFQGNLVYATGGLHQTRRWYRAIRLHCQELRVNASQLSTEQLWEYQLLQQAIADNQISLEQAKSILRCSTDEVFFSLFSQPTLKREWQPSKELPAKITPSLLLSPAELKEVLSSAQQLWEEWKEMGLSSVLPEQVPILRPCENLQKRVSEKSLLVLNRKFNGQNTWWDIAVKKHKGLSMAPRILNYFLKQGWIDMKAVPDLPSPLEHLRLVYSAMNRPQPLIACIDDSKRVGQYLERALTPVGYRVLKILDPMAGMATLAKYNPDLMFIDLGMSSVNGYSLCSFLRKTPMFRETPIVVLSAQDDWVTRVKSNMAGASGFLTKPVTSKKILQVVEKNLKEKGDRSLKLNKNLLIANC